MIISGMKKISKFHLPASQEYALENAYLGWVPISNQTV